MVSINWVASRMVKTTGLSLLASALLFLPGKCARAALVLYHSYDDGAATVTDVSGNGHTGTLFGSAAYSSDTPGSSGLSLNMPDGGSHGYDVPSLNGYDFGSNLTVEAHVKWSGSSGDYRGFVGNGWFTNGSWELRFGREFSGTRLGMRINTSSGTVTGNVFLNEDQWHHVAMTYDGSNLRGYLDGILEFTTPHTGALNIVSNDLRVGANIDPFTEPFSGWIDELLIHDVALEPSQFGPPVVPEPSAAVLMLGLTALGIRRRRRGQRHRQRPLPNSYSCQGSSPRSCQAI